VLLELIIEAAKAKNYVAVCCSVLQCVAVCCSVLLELMIEAAKAKECVAVCCSVLQCVGVCCSVMKCVARAHDRGLMIELRHHT